MSCRADGASHSGNLGILLGRRVGDANAGAVLFILEIVRAFAHYFGNTLFHLGAFSCSSRYSLAFLRIKDCTLAPSSLLANLTA